MNMQEQGSRVVSIGFEEARSMAALGHSICHINNDATTRQCVSNAMVRPSPARMERTIETGGSKVKNRVHIVTPLLMLLMAITASAQLSTTATISSYNVSFGNVNVGSSASQNLTITNTGSKTLYVYDLLPSPNPPFALVPESCTNAIPAGKKGKCTITVTFSPSAAGTVPGTLVMSSNASNAPGTPCTLNTTQGWCQTVNLSGTGVTPTSGLTLTPSSLSFPSTNVGSSSTAQTATLQNNRRQGINITSIATSANFTQTNNCGTSLGPNGHTCQIFVKFAPTTSGSLIGTLTVNDSAGTQTTSLSGTGVAVAPTLQSVTVTPANANLVAPTTQQYTATAHYSDGSHTDVTASSAWSVTNTAPASASISASGLLTTGVAGSSTVFASYNNVTGQTDVTVTHTQAGIVVSPTTATVNTGDSQQFTAYPTYSDSTTGTTGVAATWASSSSSTAQIDIHGLAVGDAAGSATITAASGAFTNTASLTVNGTNACTTNNRTDMKVLVIHNSTANGGTDYADYPAITGTLNYLHMPWQGYDVGTSGGITQGMLYGGCHAFYNAVIVAFLDGSAYSPTSTPPVYPFTGYDVLQTFEQTFGIRQLNWYSFPSPSIGLNWNSGSENGDTGTLTSSAATAMFPYLSTNQVTVDPNAFVYLVQSPAGTPVMSGANSNALTVDYSFGDGREYLSNTFDSNQYMRHDVMLSYGLVNWVTKGTFVGEKHVFFTPQEDDWGIDDDIWAQNDGSYLTVQGKTPPPIGQYPTCTNPSSTVTGMGYRISANDATAFVNWQTNLQSKPLFANFKLYNAFNSCGLGVTDTQCGSNGSPYPNDTLTAWTQNTANSAHFGWINHTYEHEDLQVQDNGTTPQTYAVDYFQINQNILNAANFNFADFHADSMVTPDISGLDYLPALQAMVDNGVQYVVSDTSCSAEKSVNPTSCFQSPNNGPGAGFNLPIVNSNNPISPAKSGYGTSTGNVYEVPRRANNLFYNVGDPGGWQSEYDCIYTNLSGIDPNGKAYGTYTTQDIMDFIAGKKGVYPNFVDLMMQGDADPEMFHQTDLKAYDGTNSLLSDLLGETFNYYQTFFKLPVKSMSLDGLAQFMLNNRAIDNSGLVGTVNNGSSRTVTLTVTNPATIPVTGLSSAGAEQYGTQVISHVPMTAGETLTQPAP